jgi:hypothetical protein
VTSVALKSDGQSSLSQKTLSGRADAGLAVVANEMLNTSNAEKPERKRL